MEHSQSAATLFRALLVGVAEGIAAGPAQAAVPLHAGWALAARQLSARA